MSDSDYLKYRGKCKEACQELCRVDKTLKMVRGHYYDVMWGSQPHWWCIKLDGTIVDPTARQFPTKGTGEYTEFNGIVTCSECGKEVPENEATIIGNGNYAVCSTKCALRIVGL